MTGDGHRGARDGHQQRVVLVQLCRRLDHLDPEYLRYYFAAKLNSRVDDFDLNLEDFAQRVNTDLVGKVVNIASRTGNFVKKFGGVLAAQADNPLLVRSLCRLYGPKTSASCLRRSDLPPRLRVINAEVRSSRRCRLLSPLLY